MYSKLFNHDSDSFTVDDIVLIKKKRSVSQSLILCVYNLHNFHSQFERLHLNF